MKEVIMPVNKWRTTEAFSSLVMDMFKQTLRMLVEKRLPDWRLIVIFKYKVDGRSVHTPLFKVKNTTLSPLETTICTLVHWCDSPVQQVSWYKIQMSVLEDILWLTSTHKNWMFPTKVSPQKLFTGTFPQHQHTRNWHHNQPSVYPRNSINHAVEICKVHCIHSTDT